MHRGKELCNVSVCFRCRRRPCTHHCDGLNAVCTLVAASFTLLPLMGLLTVCTVRAGSSLGYLAQHPLFDQIPALAADIREPEYCCLGEDDSPAVNAWFGPAGTVTPLHTDPHHNLLCQVVGSKYVRLYSAEDTPHLHPFSQGLTTNSSQVDLDKPQDNESVAHLCYRECLLQEGEMLYIPPRWMHYVKSLTISFSVSFWWQ